MTSKPTLHLHKIQDTAFVLMDSKGKMPFVISDVKANMTEDPLTRAATVNNGVYDMTVAYASTAYCGKVEGTYALATETADGLVASAYDVKVEDHVDETPTVGLTDLVDDVTEAIDLTDAFLSGFESVVDYYFTLADKTAAAAIGAKINGNVITATTPGTVKVNVHYLLVDGTAVESTPEQINVEFKYVAPSGVLGDVEWTVNTRTTSVYLPLGSFQNSLVGASDTQLPTFTADAFTWPDGKDLNTKTVTVNDVKYGLNGTAIQQSWVAVVDDAKFYVLNNYGQFVEAPVGTKIQTPLYIKFTFDPENVLPETYNVVLNFKKGNNTSVNNDFEVPVNVIINSPAVSSVNPFQRLSAYFTGDDAVAYGTADGAKVTYNLYNLFKEMSPTEIGNVKFTEKLHEIDYHTCAPWIQNAQSGYIEVGVYDNSQYPDNRDNVYSTREITGTYTVYGNVHIPYIVEKFNLTIKSEIAEGTLNSSVKVAGKGIDPINISLKDFTALDANGKAYNLAPTYKVGSTKNVYDALDKNADDRLQFVAVVPADENADEYLKINTDPTGLPIFEPNKTDAFSHFSVMRKTPETVLTSDVECKLYVLVLDKWGVYSYTTITVTLQK